MKESKKTQFQLISGRFKKISQELFEEWKLKYPSHHRLESSASEIIQTLKNTEIDDKDFKIWKSWKIRDLDIFIADLVGELHHDYNKRLVRYHGKWTKEKRKIDTLISGFRQKFDSNEE